MRLTPIPFVALALALPLAALASATPEEIASLGGEAVTCMGAERAGNAAGTIPAWSGKWYKTWPGQTKPHGYEPGPYADEKPLFTVTAANMAEHADKLTPGQQAMLQKYPDSYRLNVYPTHRDFRFADWVCDIVKKNAKEAALLDDGKGISGTTGAHPFPFPKSGLEAIWNVINPHRAMTDKAVTDIANVYANGSIAWGRNRFMTFNPGNDPDPAKRSSYTDPINAYFFTAYILPRRDRGFVAVGYQPNNFAKDATQAWQYIPGTRRVRQAPEVGFDTPVPPAGMRTVDDDYIFNGSPERYSWKLVGKRELYMPFHNNRVNDPSVAYADLIKPNTINPDYVRYELRRVWVIEGELKDGVRHIYKKRTVYADEDTWLALWGDAYDNRDELWRTSFVAYFYSQESGTYHRGASMYHDLTANAYEAGYLTNERGEDWWRLNLPMTPDDFSPQAAARAGH